MIFQLDYNLIPQPVCSNIGLSAKTLTHILKFLLSKYWDNVFSVKTCINSSVKTYPFKIHNLRRLKILMNKFIALIVLERLRRLNIHFVMGRF